MRHLNDSGGYLPPERLPGHIGRAEKSRRSMKRIPWSLFLVAGFLVTGLALAQSPQAIVMNVGSAASGGLVNFTLNAYDSSQLNVQTVVANGDTSAQVAAKIVATVTAMGGTTWSAQASYNGVPGAITFAYNPGTGWLPVSKI